MVKCLAQLWRARVVYLTLCCDGKCKCEKPVRMLSLGVNKSEHILSVAPAEYASRAKSESKQYRSDNKRRRKWFFWLFSIFNSQFMSKTKLVSLGCTSFVFRAWQVNMEFRSDLWTDGQSSRFSITSPELYSYWSSTCKPFMSQRTCGWGRPVKGEREKKTLGTSEAF